MPGRYRVFGVVLTIIGLFLIFLGVGGGYGLTLETACPSGGCVSTVPGFSRSGGVVALLSVGTIVTIAGLEALRGGRY